MTTAVPPELKLEFACTVRASLGTPVVIGEAPEGLRRFVPIVGGSFEGPLLTGKVVPGSGDWQVLRANGVLAAEAKYTLQTTDGTLIAVTNRGIRQGSPEIMERLNRGETVPASSYYFRTSATFETTVGGKYDWVNRTLFVSTAEREPSTAVIHFFRVL